MAMTEKQKDKIRKRIEELQKQLDNRQLDRKGLDEVSKLFDIAEKEGMLSMKERMSLKALRRLMPLLKKIIK